MNINDAANILQLTNTFDIKALKTAYRRLTAQYHPDRNDSGEHMQKMLNEAYSSLKAALKDKDTITIASNESDGSDYCEQLSNALNAIASLGLTVEICGNWAWVSGDTRQHKEALKAAGFRWSPKKLMWHYRPAEYKSKNRGNWSMDKIRQAHGSVGFKAKSKLKLKAA